MSSLAEKASSRIASIASHLGLPSHAPSDDDIVIISALRTPITRAKKGPFKEAHPEELLGEVLKALLTRTGIDPKLVQDVCIGTVCPPGGGAAMARMASLWAGLPTTTSVSTCNRQCSSGLQACAHIVHAIKAGVIDIGIGGGMESMSLYYGSPQHRPTSLSGKILEHPDAKDCLIPMGITSENVASKFGVSRKDQDEFAVRSHKKAAAARARGAFTEIVPVTVTLSDGSTQTVSQDDGIRPETTFEGLSKLKPAFDPSGSTTAGNASQVSDGASAVLFMKRSTAKKLGLTPVGKWISFATAGVPPSVMGIGPAYAIPLALEKAGLPVSAVSIYEINEAFASQALYCVRKLEIPLEKVNPRGGAIALGHPLGNTGSRMVGTLLSELKEEGKGGYGVISMCIGTGMGAAAVIKAE